LPVPSLDTKAFLKLWQLDLAAHPPRPHCAHMDGDDPVKPAPRRPAYSSACPRAVKLELTLARIKKGSDAFFVPPRNAASGEKCV